MSQIILSLSSVVQGTVIILYPILSFIFYLKNKCYQRLLFFIGLLMIGIGTLIQTNTPLKKITINEAGKILSSSNTPLIWYIGSVTVSIGLIVSVIGFALIVFRKNLDK